MNRSAGLLPSSDKDRILVHSNEEMNHLIDSDELFEYCTLESFARLYLHKDGPREDCAILHCVYDMDGSLLDRLEETSGMFDNAEQIICPVWRDCLFGVICIVPPSKRVIVLTEPGTPDGYWEDHVLYALRHCFGTKDVAGWDICTKIIPGNKSGCDCGPLCCLTIRKLLDGSDPYSIIYTEQDTQHCRRDVIQMLQSLYEHFALPV